MPLLNLSRRPGEAIVINDNVTIRVMGFDRGGIAIGIEAPREVLVLREELLEPERNRNPSDQPGSSTDFKLPPEITAPPD